MIHYWKVPHVSTHWDQLENVIVGLGALLNECLCIVHLDDDERDVQILVMKEIWSKKIMDILISDKEFRNRSLVWWSFAPYYDREWRVNSYNRWYFCKKYSCICVLSLYKFRK